MSLGATLDAAVKEAKDSGKHVLAVMRPSHDKDGGDFKCTWDPENVSEVSHARATFEKFKNQGMAAFRVDDEGEQAELMRDFDPKARAMIMAPPVAGG